MAALLPSLSDAAGDGASPELGKGAQFDTTDIVHLGCGSDAHSGAAPRCGGRAESRESAMRPRFPRGGGRSSCCCCFSHKGGGGPGCVSRITKTGRGLQQSRARRCGAARCAHGPGRGGSGGCVEDGRRGRSAAEGAAGMASVAGSCAGRAASCLAGVGKLRHECRRPSRLGPLPGPGSPPPTGQRRRGTEGGGGPGCNGSSGPDARADPALVHRFPGQPPPL